MIITTGTYAELSPQGQEVASYLEKMVGTKKIEVPML
ncbi:MAG: hypothetical protein ACI8O8_002074, partial [Oleiphilaceae bacterium]